MRSGTSSTIATSPIPAVRPPAERPARRDGTRFREAWSCCATSAQTGSLARCPRGQSLLPGRRDAKRVHTGAGQALLRSVRREAGSPVLREPRARTSDRSCRLRPRVERLRAWLRHGAPCRSTAPRASLADGSVRAWHGAAGVASESHSIEFRWAATAGPAGSTFSTARVLRCAAPAPPSGGCFQWSWGRLDGCSGTFVRCSRRRR